MTPRRATIGALVAAAVIASGVAVWAANGRSGGRIDSQEYAWTEDLTTTTTTEWTDIPGLRVTTSCPSNFKTSAAVSLELTEGSAPVEVRVEQDDITLECVDCPGPEGLLHPAAVTFAAPAASSFTFVGRSIGAHGTRFETQWRIDPRSSAGGSATLESGSLHLLWNDTRGPCL